MTTPIDTHNLRAYWGAARRIRLEFSANCETAPCGILGTVDSLVVRGWRQRPYGANYAAWHHPLTPYYRQKPTDTDWLPVHAQPGGVGYRHWVGLLFDDAADAPTRRAACGISTFRDRRLFQVGLVSERIHWRLLAAGYDMDNMKARGFVESEMPVIEPAKPDRTREFVLLLRQLIAGATEAASLLGRAVRRALFSDGAKVALDAGVLTDLRGRSRAATETPFLLQVEEAGGERVDAETVRRAWLRDLSRTVRTLFLEAAPIDAIGADHHPGRIAAAAKDLGYALKGYGKDGASLLNKLGLPVPEMSIGGKAKAKSGKARP